MSAFLNCNTRECKLPNRRDLSAGEDIDMTAFLSAYEFSPLPNSEGAMRAHDDHPQARHGFDVERPRNSAGAWSDVDVSDIGFFGVTQSFGPYPHQGPAPTIQPDASYRHGSLGGTYILPTPTYTVQRQPHAWIDSSSYFQEHVLHLSTYPLHIHGSRLNYNMPALSSVVMDPLQSSQCHPQWPCNSTYGPCLLLQSSPQVFNQYMIPDVGSSTASQPIPNYTPNSGYNYSDNEALANTILQSAVSGEYISPYAMTALPGASIPGSEAPIPSTQQSPTVIGAIMGHPSAEPLSYATPQPQSQAHIMPPVERCVREIALPPQNSKKSRTFQHNRPQRSRAASKQGMAAIKPQRTLLPRL